VETMTKGYFEVCDDQAEISLSNMYYYFLQSWILNTVFNIQDYDKLVFWFTNEKLDYVTFVKDKQMVKSESREQWLARDIDLDDKTKDSDFSKNYIENEGRFADKIKLQYAYTPINDTQFIIGVVKDSLGTK
jgi:hypothetical protein